MPRERTWQRLTVTLQGVPMTFLKPKTGHPPIGILICYEMWCSFFNPPSLITILWSRVLQFDYTFCEKVLPFPLVRPCRYPSDAKTNLQWSYFTFGWDFLFIYFFNIAWLFPTENPKNFIFVAFFCLFMLNCWV